MDDSEYFFFKKFLGRSLLKVFFYIVSVRQNYLFLLFSITIF